MENKVNILFEKENEEIELDISNPDLANLVHIIVSEQLEVTRENLKLTTNVENFDTTEFLDILVSVHNEFQEEIEKFYNNIKTDIKTYYDDETIGEEIIRRIKEENK